MKAIQKDGAVVPEGTGTISGRQSVQENLVKEIMSWLRLIATSNCFPHP